jgi:hypothetical protein
MSWRGNMDVHNVFGGRRIDLLRPIMERRMKAMANNLKEF